MSRGCAAALRAVPGGDPPLGAHATLYALLCAVAALHATCGDAKSETHDAVADAAEALRKRVVSLDATAARNAEFLDTLIATCHLDRDARARKVVQRTIDAAVVPPPEAPPPEAARAAAGGNVVSRLIGVLRHCRSRFFRPPLYARGADRCDQRVKKVRPCWSRVSRSIFISLAAARPEEPPGRKPAICLDARNFADLHLRRRRHDDGRDRARGRQFKRRSRRTRPALYAVPASSASLTRERAKTAAP